MKDKHGVMRGHCGVANCECRQYRPPPPEYFGGKQFCEYCDHLPGKHQRVVALGPCLGCGVDNCERYEPDNDWSYSECQYCGCEASCHKGAEHLKQDASTSSSGASPTVKVDATGMPLQSFSKGSCKYPGCKYGRRVDPSTGHIMDYCSKTCADKDIARLSSAAAAAESARGTSGMRLGSSFTSSVPVSSKKICTKCNTNPANPGRKWCQQCFLGKASSNPSSCTSTKQSGKP